MIQNTLSVVFILMGLTVFIISAVGNFRVGFVLNRMQVSANSDTLGVSSIITGLIIANGFNMITAKLLVMLIFMWFANPVAGHILAKTEIIVNDEIEDEVEVVYYDDI